ncbi:hypothetical protein B0H10DRAFT_1956868 [Mycena sp. CBHHK59/15]|nr:hypothetical protein B0H10DRAFT_1956868 [Mycena sp. CBHHK59/15]
MRVRSLHPGPIPRVPVGPLTRKRLRGYGTRVYRICAATLILETIPANRDYNGELNAEQRGNLTANGQDVLQNLGKLKTALVDRYERYTRGGAVSTDVPAFKAASALHTAQPPTGKRSQAQMQALQTAVQQATAEELPRWRVQRADAAATDAALGRRGVPAPAPAHLPVSFAQHAQQGQGQVALIPASFRRGNSSAAGAYGAYWTSAGVSLPQPAHASANTGTSAGVGGNGGGGNSYVLSYTSSSPTSYAPPQFQPQPAPQTHSQSYSQPQFTLNCAATPSSTPNYTSPYPSTISTPSHAYSSSPTSSSSSIQSAPGPMPIRPPYPSSVYEWQSASESTDEERADKFLYLLFFLNFFLDLDFRRWMLLLFDSTPTTPAPTPASRKCIHPRFAGSQFRLPFSVRPYHDYVTRTLFVFVFRLDVPTPTSTWILRLGDLGVLRLPCAPLRFGRRLNLGRSGDLNGTYTADERNDLDIDIDLYLPAVPFRLNRLVVLVTHIL